MKSRLGKESRENIIIGLIAVAWIGLIVLLISLSS
jgi:hypothetical protein